MIEVKDLVKRYGNHVAVDHLNFTVEKGEVLGFLGPNGAGKSTTMNMITGYISATEGSVIINGHDVYEEPEEAKKSIGYLPELPPVYNDMTVKEYLNFVADIKKVDRKKRNKMITDIMERVKIINVSERLIKHLSKGYKQRVGLAQAIIGYPEVIILDEPTVGLDPMQIIEIRDLIKDLAKSHTIILSSHILQEVSAVCDSIMIINKGKLIVRDHPENLPKHLRSREGLKLVIKGDKKLIHTALSEIPAITNIEYSAGVMEDLISLNVMTKDNADVREEVFYAMSKADCPIYSMNASVMSLEDIFLQIVKEDDEVREKISANKKKKELLNKKEIRKQETQEVQENQSDQVRMDNQEKKIKEQEQKNNQEKNVNEKASEKGEE